MQTSVTPNQLTLPNQTPAVAPGQRPVAPSNPEAAVRVRGNGLNAEGGSVTLSFEQAHAVDPLAVSQIEGDRPYYFFFKRVLDVVLTAVALLALLPFMALIAVLIAWDSPGPVIFAQQRVGARRRVYKGRQYWQRSNFTIYKFRSMYANAGSELHRQYIEAYIAGDEARMAALQPKQDGAQTRFKTHGAPRTPRGGPFLRKPGPEDFPQL